MPYLRRESGIFVLSLGHPDETDTENRFTPRWLDEAIECIDEAEASPGPTALVTVGTGKFYSNGFDPERFDGEPAAVRDYLLAGQRLFARILASELPTVAALSGHTFAGGAILAMAHDRRIMRSDRGYLCLPEIAMGLPIPAGMSDLLLARLQPNTAHEAMLTGHRYTGTEALSAGMVDELAEEANVLPAALARAAAVAATRGPVLAQMKRHMYRHVLAALGSLDPV